MIGRAGGPRSPDCRDGKCGACVGLAWDLVVDELTSCRCRCHGDDALVPS